MLFRPTVTCSQFNNGISFIDIENKELDYYFTNTIYFVVRAST